MSSTRWSGKVSSGEYMHAEFERSKYTWNWFPTVHYTHLYRQLLMALNTNCAKLLTSMQMSAPLGISFHSKVTVYGGWEKLLRNNSINVSVFTLCYFVEQSKICVIPEYIWSACLSCAMSVADLHNPFPYQRSNFWWPWMLMKLQELWVQQLLAIFLFSTPFPNWLLMKVETVVISHKILTFVYLRSQKSPSLMSLMTFRSACENLSHLIATLNDNDATCMVMLSRNTLWIKKKEKKETQTKTKKTPPPSTSQSCFTYFQMHFTRELISKLAVLKTKMVQHQSDQSTVQQQQEQQRHLSFGLWLCSICWELHYYYNWILLIQNSTRFVSEL